MIDICQWRVSIGLWYQVSCDTKSYYSTNGQVQSGESTLTFCFVMFVLLLLILSGDIELNPGPMIGMSLSTYQLCNYIIIILHITRVDINKCFTIIS